MRFIVGVALFLAVGLPVRAQETEPQPEIGKEFILLRTNMGDLLLALFPKSAPRHCEQVVKLARLGVFDNCHFYRVERGFVAQIVDHRNLELPLTPSQAAAIRKLPRELSPIPHVRGILTMAHSDPPMVDDAETSFSIMLGTAPHLDNEYTVFGRLEKGHEVLAAIEAAAVSGNEPQSRISILHVDVIDTVEKREQLILRGPPLPATSDPVAIIADEAGTGVLWIIVFVFVGFMILAGTLAFPEKTIHRP
jgi:cyclophilin family peptidyl-prolyl cis-trans isomerase